MVNKDTISEIIDYLGDLGFTFNHTDENEWTSITQDNVRITIEEIKDD